MSQHRAPKGLSAAKYMKQSNKKRSTTWADKVLARKNFTFKAMSVVFRVRFESYLDSGADKGAGNTLNGIIHLNQELSDEILLNTAAHEYLEILSIQMGWNLGQHSTVCALGMAVSEIVR